MVTNQKIFVQIIQVTSPLSQGVTSPSRVHTTIGQLSVSKNETKLMCHQLTAVSQQDLYVIVYKQMKRSRQNFVITVVR